MLQQFFFTTQKGSKLAVTNHEKTSTPTPDLEIYFPDPREYLTRDTEGYVTKRSCVLDVHLRGVRFFNIYNLNFASDYYLVGFLDLFKGNDFEAEIIE